MTLPSNMRSGFGMLDANGGTVGKTTSSLNSPSSSPNNTTAFFFFLIGLIIIGPGLSSGPATVAAIVRFMPTFDNLCCFNCSSNLALSKDT